MANYQSDAKDSQNADHGNEWIQAASVTIRRKPEKPPPPDPPRTDDQTAGILKKIWTDAENKNNIPAETDQKDFNTRLLARHYHNAILKRLPKPSARKQLRRTQAAGYLNDFLAMEKHCESKRIPVILRRFARRAGESALC